jgi:pyridoxal phosphate enzyme (YggS family)
MNKHIEKNLLNIENSIKKQSAKWKQPAPLLVAVSKNRNILDITSAISYGHKRFAENKLQEAQKKWIDIKKNYPNTILHLVGHLQSNKVKDALELFDIIESIDREKIAMAITKHIQPKTKKEFLIQINIGEESQKHGILPNQADEFIQFCKNKLKLPIKGLMCIPPIDENPSLFFAYMKKIADKNNLSYLSMGMSKDYDKAIAIGTNEVRIGRAIFEK